MSFAKYIHIHIRSSEKLFATHCSDQGRGNISEGEKLGVKSCLKSGNK